jgi:hypothetical protein
VGKERAKAGLCSLRLSISRSPSAGCSADTLSQTAMFKTSETANGGNGSRQLLTDRFRCPEHVADFAIRDNLSRESGYFRLDSDAICYGQCASGIPARYVTDPLHDASQHLATHGSTVQLPFDPAQVVDNFRRERYPHSSNGGKRTFSGKNIARSMYYMVRPLLAVAVRKHFQRMYLRDWDKTVFPTWPVDRTVDNIFEKLLVLAMKSQRILRVPFIWFWPEGAESCAMVTHDVETSAGVGFCQQLMDLNDRFAIKTSFQIIPEKRYPVPQPFLEGFWKRGFEVNVHDLNHDGHLFSDREEFLRRAERINRYGKQFGAQGFRSAVLYRNVDWYDALDFSYDMSVPNVAHLEPQAGGCCTVLPFFIGKILELPVTTTQDYWLFHILNDYSIRLWREQIRLIQQKHGLISFIVHPDYIIAKEARRVYTELLHYLSELRRNGETWIALPGEVAAWWRMRSAMNLVNVGGSWQIEGQGKEHARLAYATMVDNTLAYEIERAAPKAGATPEGANKL